MRQDRRFGLCQVYPDTRDNEATAEKKVDIIFMHGLDAQSPKTWIAWEKEDDPYSGDVNWLCDEHMLPQSMEYARILTYDWNANYDTTASSDRFLGHADTLLDRVYVNREELCRLQTPLIFVASCFSGLLLAQALVRATERYHPRGQKYRQVLDFTIGVAFLGTPFRGSWDMGYTIADLRIAVAIEAGGEYNRELIEYIRQGTVESPGPLDDLVQRFSEMIHHEDFKFGKVCFYETRHTNFSAYRKKLPKDYAARLDAHGHGIVVTKNSACLQGVEGVALDVRHNMLHKFNSPKNDVYQRLVSRLKGFVEKAPYVLGVNGYKDAYLGADILLREKEKEEAERRTQCLKALYFDGIDYEPGKIREPGKTACQWLLEDQSYSSWHNNGRGVFWILGDPGSGKSTLIKHAIHSCRENAPAGSARVLSFFFHNEGKLLQHTIEGLLRSLLYQLLEEFPEQTSTFIERFDARKAKSIDGPGWRASYLMRHLESCLEKVVERYDLRVFVDALDYLLSSGFRILDPTLRTSRDILNAGHDMLLASCFWLMTEADLDDSFERWMESFSKSIVLTTLRALPSKAHTNTELDAVLGIYLPELGENPRIKVDGMDGSDRHYMQQYLNPNNIPELKHGYPQVHRQIDYTGELKEWLLIDEFISCCLGITGLVGSMPPHVKYFIDYCHEHWSHHALQSLENGSEDAVNKRFAKFFSRAQNSLFCFYSLVMCPLQEAAGLPNLMVLRNILSRDVENHFRLNSAPLERKDATALMVAAERCYEDNVRILLHQEGIRDDKEDLNGQTALFKAVDSKSKSIGELLINRNANMDLRDSHGRTALIYSVRNGLDEVMELFLQGGAKPLVEDVKGLTAFDYAIDKGNTQLCRHILRDLPRQKRLDFVSPKRMAMACKKGNVDIVRLFLENGTKTGIPERQAQSKILFSETSPGAAIETDQRTVLELLLGHESTHTGLPRGNNSWWTLEELGTGRQPRANTCPLSLAWLLFIPCLCAAIAYTCWENVA